MMLDIHVITPWIMVLWVYGIYSTYVYCMVGGMGRYSYHP